MTRRTAVRVFFALALSFVLLERVYAGGTAVQVVYGDHRTENLTLGLQAAVDYAVSNRAAELRISGSWVLSNGPDIAGLSVAGATNLTLSGGWNAAFTAQGGPSVLDGAGRVCHVVRLEDCSGLTLTNFRITGGNARGASPERNGGGIYAENVDGSLIVCSVSGNTAAYYGGGIYLSNSISNAVRGKISGNTAGKRGGGVCIAGCEAIALCANVSGNTVKEEGGEEGGGGVCIFYSRECTVTGAIANNSGTGLQLEHSSANIVDAMILSNFTACEGGGIYFIYANDNLIYGKISGNRTTGSGGGISLYSCLRITIDAEISDNSARWAGGVGTGYCGWIVIRGIVTNNTASENGGGLSLFSENDTISCLVAGNTAERDGGGIYFGLCHNMNVTGTVTGNRAGRNGGGITSFGSYANVSGTVSKNRAGEMGGGLLGFHSSGNYETAAFSGNTAGGKGAGACVSEYGSDENVFSDSARANGVEICPDSAFPADYFEDDD